MAKKLAQNTMGFEDPPPPEVVQDAADKYVSALTKKNKAAEAFNGAKEQLITEMKAHGITRIKVNNGAKVLTLVESEKVLLKKPAEPTAAVDDDDE